MIAVPYCKLCGEWEVGTFTGSTEFCSDACIDKAYEYTLASVDEVAYDEDAVWALEIFLSGE